MIVINMIISFKQRIIIIRRDSTHIRSKYEKDVHKHENFNNRKQKKIK
jgi:hypothetical protein